MSPGARARLAEVAAGISYERYPDASVEKLRAALANHCQVNANEVLVGVGSDEVIALMLSALSRPRAGADAPVVLTTTPSFVMYAMSARMRAQRVLEVPLGADWDLATPSLLAALRVAEPGLVFIASPNNPTGNKMSLDRLVTLIEAVPRSLVVVDEAYIDYSDVNQLELYRRYPNVAVLRTLSKVGFAALRVGWLLAAPELVQELEVPYRIVNVAAGDLGAGATKKYDIEAWFPSQQRYREITSTSNTTDFQARRLGVRFRTESGLEPVHTLNGTAVTARVLLAIIENFQEADGTWASPAALKEFGAP